MNPSPNGHPRFPEVRVPDFSDLEPYQTKMRILGYDYIITEASGDAVVKFRNAKLKAAKLGPDGKATSLDGLADAEPILVAECMYRTGPSGGLELDANGLPKVEYKVSPQRVRSWPQRVQKELYDFIQQISGMEEDTVESLEQQLKLLNERLAQLKAAKGDPAKNSPSPTPAGSDSPSGADASSTSASAGVGR